MFVTPELSICPSKQATTSNPIQHHATERKWCGVGGQVGGGALSEPVIWREGGREGKRERERGDNWCYHGPSGKLIRALFEGRNMKEFSQCSFLSVIEKKYAEQKEWFFFLHHSSRDER